MNNREEILNFCIDAAHGKFDKKYIMNSIFDSIEYIIGGITDKSIELDEDGDDVGYIFIFSDNIEIKDTEIFMNLFNTVSYIDFAPVEDGSVIMTVVMYELSTEV